MSDTPRPARPDYAPFRGLPDLPALARLQARPQWVAWEYRWNDSRAKWDKIPVAPRTGQGASSSDPTTWATYEEAAAYATRRGFPGVGFVLSGDDGLTGIDLDACRDPATGALDGWAADILAHGETYAEVSPSGRGVRLFADGKVAKATKLDAAHVEIYGSLRYLTVTGQQLDGAPDEIRPAPKTLAALHARVAEFKATAEAEKRARSAEREPPRAGPAAGLNYFRAVNDAALNALGRWVPELFGSAATFHPGTGSYRVSSRDLGRNLEEDLSVAPGGIKDWGVHDMGDRRDGGRTAVDLVMEYGGAPDALVAADWLCDRLGLDPADMGRRASGAGQGDARAGAAGSGRTGNERGAGGQDRAKPDGDGPRTVAQDGLLVSAERDRLKIVQDLAPATEFPTTKLPPLLQDAITALEEHVQAPRAMCAHSILSAATLCAQTVVDVDVACLPVPKPLSLFYLVVAASGERKSACDDLALRGVAEIERERGERYAEELRQFKAAKSATDMERKKIEGNKKLARDEKERLLLDLPEPVEPLHPFIRTKEGTFEGLFNFAKKGRGSTGLFTSEAGQFLGGHGMNDEARLRTMTGMSELWDSGTAQRMRAHELTRLEGTRVAVSLAAQQTVAARLLGDETARDQGFVGRFLMMMPDSTIGTRQIRVSRPRDDERLRAFHRRCRLILDRTPPLRDGTCNELDLPALTLDPLAWQVWQGVAQSIENGCVREGLWFPIRSAALKMAENIARIAGVLTVFQDPAARTITGETMAVAAEIGGFYLQEAARLVGHIVADAATQSAADLADWIATKWPHSEISPTLIQQRAPAHLRGDANKTRALIRKLCEAGVLELKGKGTIEGKPYRETFVVHRAIDMRAAA